MSLSVSYPLRLPQDLEDKINAARKRLHLSKQETIRLLISIGLADLQRIDFDIPAAIVARARRPALEAAPKARKK